MTSNSFYHIEFLPAALHDMTEIISSFVMLGSRSKAVGIKEKINKAALQIARFPYSGVTICDKKLARSGYRMIAAEKYLMLYRIFEDENKAVFYRVLNGTIYYPNLLKRLDPEA